MDAAIILPARLKSTRLPNKLLLAGSGKTILEHTIARAQHAIERGLSARIIVAVDDEKLLVVARRAGAEAVMTDPNHNSGTDRVAEAALAIKEQIIVNLQADEPEIDPASIVQVAGLLSQTEKAPMATLAVQLYDEEIWKRPNVVKVVMSSAGYALNFSRAPVPFMRDPESTRLSENSIWRREDRRVYGLHHIGIYAYRRDFLLSYKTLPHSDLENLEKLEQLRALEAGYSIKVALAGSNPPGIDTPEDYQAFLSRQKKRN